jgi:aminoglycoside phosphotransferase
VSESTYIRWAVDRLNVPDPAVKRARSGDNSTVFEIEAGDARWFLKVGDRLARECAGLRWPQGRLPVPLVVAFDRVEAADALLTVAMPGTNLARLAKSVSSDSVVEMLASALRARSIRLARKTAHSGHMPRANRSSTAIPACRISWLATTG